MTKIVILIMLTLSAYCSGQMIHVKAEIKADNNDFELLGTATIHSLVDSTLVKGSYIDSSYFILSFNSKPNVNYFLKLKFQGFQDTIINFSTADSIVLLGTIILSPTMMEEVQVSYKKPLYERTIDGIKVNVEGTSLEKLTNLFEVLKASPKISSPDNQSIEIIGKGTPLILIDKQPVISMDELKAIPADQIHQIEIMTNPSAKYRAQSKGGGVIEIITKNFHLEGYKITMGLEGGTTTQSRPSSGIRFGLSFKKKKYSLDFNLGGSYDMTNSFSNSLGTTTDGTQRGYSTDYSAENWWTWHNLNLKSSYQINSKHQLTAGLRSYGSVGSNIIQTSVTYGELQDTSSRQVQDTKSNSTWLNNSAFLKYTIQLDTIGSSLDVNLNYLLKVNEGISGIESSFINQLTSNKANFSRRNITKDRPNIGELQIDYLHLFDTTGWKLSLGGIYSLLFNGKEFNQYKLENGESTIDEKFSNSYDYQEQVAGLYAEISKMWKHLGFRIGIREEYTSLDGYSRSLQKQFIDSSYFLPFPSASFILKPHDKLTLTLFYQTGIVRPSFNNYDPFVRILDSVTVEFGNPYLKPEKEQSIGMQVDLFNKYNFNLSYSFDRNPISSISFISDTSFTVNTTPWNSSSEESINFDIGIPIDIKWLQGSNSLWVNYSKYKYPSEFSRSPFTTFTYGFYSRLNFLMPKKFELTSFLYISQFASDQYIVKPVVFWGLRLNKKIKNDNLQVYFDADNLLPVRHKTTAYSGNYEVYTESRFVFTTFKLGVFYKFGKLKQSINISDSKSSQSGRI